MVMSAVFFTYLLSLNAISTRRQYEGQNITPDQQWNSLKPTSKFAQQCQKHGDNGVLFHSSKNLISRYVEFEFLTIDLSKPLSQKVQ